jgi:hypothetical protein
MVLHVNTGALSPIFVRVELSVCADAMVLQALCQSLEGGAGLWGFGNVLAKQSFILNHIILAY